MATSASKKKKNALEDSETYFDYLFKIVIVGEAGVGKTSIAHRFKYNTFAGRYASTIGVDFTVKTIIVDGKKVKLQIWDTAGQERFRTITQSYYRTANAVVLVYDITSSTTYKNIVEWLEDVKKYSDKCLHKILVGNKCDLECNREVSRSEVEKFATHHEIEDTMETSAKNDSNIDDIFIRTAKYLKDIYDRPECQKCLNLPQPNDQQLVLDTLTKTTAISATQDEKKGCCGF